MPGLARPLTVVLEATVRPLAVDACADQQSSLDQFGKLL
jgi:hypothetical protein